MKWLQKLKAKWEYRKHVRPTDAGFKAWVSTRMPKQKYDAYDAKVCALGTYVRALGWEPMTADDSFTYMLAPGEKWRPTETTIDAVMHSVSPRTYGKLSERLS